MSLNVSLTKTIKGFIYSPTDALVSWLKKKQY